MIVTNIEKLRDPFVLVDDGTYYVYGTGVDDDDWNNTMWTCYKNTDGRLDGEWKKLERSVAVLPEYAEKNRWAPEVYKHNGSYYMFTTYYSSLTGNKGCTVLKADSPEGPFLEISNGLLTPSDWDSIDGTLYIDTDGTPWMIFVHEWSSTSDGIGRMAAAKLSDDLTHFVSEVVELFRADEPCWAQGDFKITDGCFMYRAADGQLLMIWSNFDKDGYCVGVSRSKNGKVDGEWNHDEELLFSKSKQESHDGGHGMIFKDTDGKMYLSLHSPNRPTGTLYEKTVFIPIREENGCLICDFSADR